MAGVGRAERALQAIFAHCKNNTTAKLMVSTEGGALKVNLEETFASNDVCRKVLSATKGYDSKRGSPSWRKRKEERATDPAVRQKAAAHAEKAAAEKAAAEKAAAEKAAAEKAAAEKAAAGKAAAEKAAEEAAAARKAAGARHCSKCHRPTLGHSKPIGDQCTAAVLPSPEKLLGPRADADSDSKIITPVKEDREEPCSCCGEPLSPTHQCDEEVPSEEEDINTEDSQSEESEDYDICKQEGRRCRLAHPSGENIYCTENKCVCDSDDCQKRNKECKKCKCSACSFVTVTPKKRKKKS
jgi:hypothetical protein